MPKVSIATRLTESKFVLDELGERIENTHALAKAKLVQRLMISLNTDVLTAIENGLDAQKNLTYLFTHLPENELSNKAALAAYLRWADEVRQT